MRTKCSAYLVFFMLAGLTPARAADQSTGTVVRAIQIVEDGGVTHVTIEADGPLPLPQSAALNDPPRIYFDLPGVTHKISGTSAQSGGVVSRVRVALHTVSPQITRVVLDLSRLENYRVNTDERQAGRIRVLVGSESSINPAPATRGPILSPVAAVSTNSLPSSVPPARTAEVPAPPPPVGNSTPSTMPRFGTAPPMPSPAIAPASPVRSPVLSPQEPRPALPARVVEVYRKQIAGLLARMEVLRAVVARIDAAENIGSDTLASAAKEFTDLRRTLEKVQPSAVLAVTHDLLMTSCTLSAMASRLGIDAAWDGTMETRQRAASAAAGSLMLFDRACGDLGCTRMLR